MNEQIQPIPVSELVSLGLKPGILDGPCWSAASPKLQSITPFGYHQNCKIRVGELDVPVRGERNAKGKPGTLGAVGAGIVFLPFAIIVRGKDVTLPAGAAF